MRAGVSLWCGCWFSKYFFLGFSSSEAHWMYVINLSYNQWTSLAEVWYREILFRKIKCRGGNGIPTVQCFHVSTFRRLLKQLWPVWHPETLQKLLSTPQTDAFAFASIRTGHEERGRKKSSHFEERKMATINVDPWRWTPPPPKSVCLFIIPSVLSHSSLAPLLAPMERCQPKRDFLRTGYLLISQHLVNTWLNCSERSRVSFVGGSMRT